MVRTIIQLDDEQHRELKRIARERHKSMSALIREGVDRIIRDAVAPEDRKRRALEVAGKYRSGIRDLAEKHDAYLAEDYGEETR
ncbi:MAG: CopG family transcriptional regulator [Actinomycetota bacterium]|nr:CopG family transcriptional regulator [Actinomycetota bacterium]MDD5666447.1 CopG family transcriptional regulator [Actinomycetota bacterium]